MKTLQDIKSLYQGFQKNFPAPQWMEHIREHAWEKTKDHQLPSRKDETWKHTSLSFLEKNNFSIDTTKPHLNQEYVASLFKPKYLNLMFVDGVFDEKYLQELDLPKGVSITPLEQVPQESYEKILEIKSLKKKTSKDYMTHLNEIFLKHGVFIHVEKRTELNTPIHLIHLSTTQDKHYFSTQKNYLYLEEQAQATIYESFYSYPQEDHKEQANIAVENVHFDFFLKKNSRLTYGKTQTEKAEHNKHQLSSHCFFQQESSALEGFYFFAGAFLARQNVAVFLQGKHAHTVLDGLYLAKGEQHLDLCVDIFHQGPQTKSSQFFKGILNDRARGVFQGNITVHKEAVKTDAKQLNKNLILSTAAEVDTKPQLEIDTDDVKCAHGATVSQIRGDEIFYLQSRGLAKPQAIQILSSAFAKEILDKHETFSAKHDHVKKVKEFLEA